MRARPRLVHVTTTDISLALLLGPQLEAFREAGYAVVGASAPGPFVDRLEAAGIRHVALRHATRAMAPHRDAAALAELTRLFRRIRPDIVHTHNPKPGVYGRLAARAAGVGAIVNTVHGLYATPDDPAAKRWLVYGLERIAAACSHLELVQNPEDVPVLLRLGVPRERVRLLGNGVDLDRFDPARFGAQVRAEVRAELGVSDDEVVCLAAGRLVNEKGYPELFEAFRRLRAQGSPARLVVVGPSDPDKADAVPAALLRRAADEGGVSLLGYRDDVERLYTGADLFVLASHREGFPRAAMEAAAMGLPIVATDIRGCRQVVDDGRTGMLVPVRDTAGLTAAIASLAGERQLRHALGTAARQKALTEFDQRQVIDTTLAAYEELLDGRGPP